MRHILRVGFCHNFLFCTQLLELEPKSSLQVPLLLKLGENKKALLSATESGDTDLVYTVLLQLKEQGFMGDFHMIIRKFPMAQNLYKKYCQQYSKSALQEVYTQEDDFLSQAEFSLREGIEVWRNYFRLLVVPFVINIHFRIPVLCQFCPLSRITTKNAINTWRLTCVTKPESC